MTKHLAVIVFLSIVSSTISSQPVSYIPLRPVFCQSEEALQDYSEPFDRFSEEIKETIKKRKKIKKELLAARGARSWKEFVNQSYKYGPHTKEGKQTRLDRFMMVTDAIDVFNEIPDVPRYDGDEPKQGRQFLKNDWFMGPFYSYDHNFLNK
jgi:hypothetical protein